MISKNGTAWSELEPDDVVYCLEHPMWYSRFIGTKDPTKKPVRNIKPMLGLPTFTFTLTLSDKDDDYFAKVNEYKDSTRFVTLGDLYASKTAQRLIGDKNIIIGFRLNANKIIRELAYAGALHVTPRRNNKTDATLEEMLEQGFVLHTGVYGPEMKIVDTAHPSRKYALGSAGADDIFVFPSEQDAKAYYVRESTRSLVDKLAEYQRLAEETQAEIDDIVNQFGQ